MMMAVEGSGRIGLYLAPSNLNVPEGVGTSSKICRVVVAIWNGGLNYVMWYI